MLLESRIQFKLDCHGCEVRRTPIHICCCRKDLVLSLFLSHIHQLELLTFYSPTVSPNITILIVVPTNQFFLGFRSAPFSAPMTFLIPASHKKPVICTTRAIHYPFLQLFQGLVPSWCLSTWYSIYCTILYQQKSCKSLTANITTSKLDHLPRSLHQWTESLLQFDWPDFYVIAYRCLRLRTYLQFKYN